MKLRIKERYQALPEKRKKGLRRFGGAVLDLLSVMAYSWCVGVVAAALFDVDCIDVAILSLVSFYIFPGHIHYETCKRLEEKAKIKDNTK